MPTGLDMLTPREADVLSPAGARALQRRDRAELSVSIETVRTHARSVFRKLGVHGRRELSDLSRAR
ncbi:MAG: LuxR C-terminal-related transcriptional regulator [Actinobacteria bacterium]|nr:LuxR C-terminal-related transcriptional regulator [Actinomycetota bacterium]